jgi:hypothetical protein
MLPSFFFGAAVCWKGEPPSVAEASSAAAVETDKLGLGEPSDGVNKREPLDSELVEAVEVVEDAPVVLEPVELLLALVNGINNKYDEPLLSVVVPVVVVKGTGVGVVVMLADVVIDPLDIETLVVAVYATEASLIILDGRGNPPILQAS